MSIEKNTSNQIPPVARLKHSSAIFNSRGRVRAAFKSPLKVEKENSEHKKDEVERVTVEQSKTVICLNDQDTVKRKRIFSGQFKTPTKTKRTETNSRTYNVHSAQERLNNLETQYSTLESEILELQSEGHKEEDLQKYINILHQYNELKDATQLVLGELAKHMHVTTSSLYQQFGLALDD